MPRDSDRRFEDFAVGDRVRFTRRFLAKDFAAFARLSGDRNPLHHDKAYAAASGFDAPILPLHLTTAPLSAVAGMMLPGHRSLYLANRVRALRPGAYDRDIVYSARILAANEANRSLTLRVLGLDEAAVLFDAELIVEVREEAPANLAPAQDGAVEIIRPGRRAVVVTGAGGTIGGAVARALAAAGHDLVLVHRGRREALADLVKACKAEGAAVAQHAADLEDGGAVKRLARTLAKRDDIGGLVHAASPGLAADPAALLAVNHGALATLAEALLPNWLAAQEGRLVLIGSSALQHGTPGLESYAAAKAAASHWVAAFDNRNAGYGVTGRVVAPGTVRTGFSDSLRAVGAEALLPEEVAEAVAESFVESEGGGYLWLERGRKRLGRFGFHEAGATPAPTAQAPQPTEQLAETPTPGTDPVAAIVREQLGAPAGADLSQAGVNAWPGWDSLRHIEVMLAVERGLGIAFTAGDMERTATYRELRDLALQKLAAKGAG